MLHPRVPPLVRAIPHLEALSLYRSEEGEEEQEMRRGLGIVTLEDASVQVDHPLGSSSAPPIQGDAVMTNGTQKYPISSLQTVPSNDNSSHATTLPSGMVIDPPPTVDSAPPAIQARAPQPTSPPPPPGTLPTSSTSISPVIPSDTRTVAISNPPSIATSSQMIVDEDEPMPGIDLGSDSEDDDE